MPQSASWLARLCVCAVVTLPLFSAPAVAEPGDSASYQARVAQFQSRNAERLNQNRAVTGGPERIIKTRATATVSGQGAAATAGKNAAGKKTAKVTDHAALECLTEAVYFESRGEPLSGQKAVAEVIMNRVDDPRFPKSVCGVVNQSGQFSYRGNVGKMRKGAAFTTAQRVAQEALSGAPRALTDGATYFHTTKVRPSWSKRFTRTTKIGAHVFYRQGGRRVASN